MSPSLRLTALIIAFTVASGAVDALAFSYAAGMWKDGRLIGSTAAKASACFVLGTALYFGALRFLAEAGVVLVEIQTLIWFAATIVGVFVLHGRIIHWQPVEQLVAVNVVLGLGWLISRTA